MKNSWYSESRREKETHSNLLASYAKKAIIINKKIIIFSWKKMKLKLDEA